MAGTQVRNNYMVYDDYVRLFQMRRLLCVQFAQSSSLSFAFARFQVIQWLKMHESTEIHIQTQTHHTHLHGIL